MIMNKDAIKQRTVIYENISVITQTPFIAPSPFKIDESIIDKDYQLDTINLIGVSIIKGFSLKAKDMSRSASLLAYYFVGELPYCSNVFVVNFENIKNIYGYTKNTVYKAINELIKLNIIAKTNITNHYIINHNYMHRGDYNYFLNHYVSIYGIQSFNYNDKGEIDIKDAYKCYNKHHYEAMFRGIHCEDIEENKNSKGEKEELSNR